MTTEQQLSEPGFVDRRMKEILKRRDEIRRASEERVKKGLAPFPSVYEVVLQREQQASELDGWESLDR